MARRSFHFTSESVSEGHPDKVCDRISDAIVDAHIAALPEARVACETLATTNRVIIAGEHRGADTVTNETIERVTREAIREIGYSQNGFHWQSVEIENLMHEQSADIAQGVDGNANKPEGAGDQGLMFGYACRETPELMPAPILYAHRILRLLADARHCGREPALGPDSKTQVTVAYEDGVPKKVDAIVLSTQHLDETLTSDDIRALTAPYIREALPEGWITNETVWHVNPTGKFVVGGPDGDTGLTGRKIIVDTYGGAALHGGGAFSGKDPSKVDRSAAYAARYLAKNIVAGGFADRCTIQLSYAIGVAQPLSIYVNTHGTSSVAEAAIEAALGKVMDLSPKGIRDHLQLNRPIYARTAAYGHFGREPDAEGGFSWEKTDLIGAIDDAL